MSTLIKLVSHLANVNGMPNDESENTVYVLHPGGPLASEVTTMREAFRDFYTVDPGATQTHPLAWYISEVVDRGANACSIDAYLTDDLSGATPFGSPTSSTSFTMPSPGGAQQFPEEVAVVLSYHGDLTDVPVSMANPTPPPATIRPAQRRRGRLFLGPLYTGAAEDGIASIIPALILRTDLGQAFKTMCNTISAGTSGDVAVWSRADGDAYPVVAGWVDDAWDIQRRRGLEPTQRTLFTV